MTTLTTPLAGRPAWKALEEHHRQIRGVHLRDLFARDPGRGERLTAEAAGIYPRLFEEPDYRGHAAAARRASPRSAACARASTPCSGARGSTSPRSGRCCTWRCAHLAAPRSWSTARTWCPAVHAVLDRMAGFANRVRGGGWSGAHRQAHPQRRQHRHRRLRSGAGHGLRGAQALQRPQPHLPVRLEHRWHRLRRGGPRSRPGRDALHRVVEDLHDARDDDQRPHRARMVAGRRRRRRPRRSRSTSSRSRPTPRKWRSSASTPPTCSGSGTGSAAATRWSPRSASRRCWRSARITSAAMLGGFHEMDEHFRTAPFAAEPAGADGAARHLEHQLPRRAHGRGAAVRAVPQALPRLPPAVDDGEQRQARDARRRRGRRTTPGRSTGENRAPTASTRSIS